MLAAAGAVGALVSLPGTARADVFCTGVPTEVNTRSDGLVMLYATWRNDWIAICSIARLSEWNVRSEVEAGRLKSIVLADAVLPDPGVWAVMPSRHHLPAKLRLFLDAFTEHLVTP